MYFKQANMLCRDFMMNKCNRTQCKFVHDEEACFHYWKHGSCKNGDACPKTHIFKNLRNDNKPKPNNKRNAKNTETFEPMSKPVDMRIVVDTSTDRLSVGLTSRDVVLVPSLFSDYAKGELYKRLEHEILNCDVPHDQLLKLWHGDTHYIADDHTAWKKKAPTFQMVLDRIAYFFDMNIQATRFNWYKDTSQWKPFHFDAASLKPEKAKVQNFTVAVSFGATRDAAFEDDRTKIVISMPQPDGSIYCFASDTNCLWRHGILKETEIRHEGRISVIAWGWVDTIKV